MGAPAKTGKGAVKGRPKAAAPAAAPRLNLVKLCVGVSAIAELEDWIAERRAAPPPGTVFRQMHVTRSTPVRREELLDGGSLYWVIAGEIAARQRLLDITAVTGTDGVPRCGLVLDPQVIRVSPRPFRPFQGWRYLAADKTPPDLASATDPGSSEPLPAELQRDLNDIGLV